MISAIDDSIRTGHHLLGSMAGLTTKAEEDAFILVNLPKRLIWVGTHTEGDLYWKLCLEVEWLGPDIVHEAVETDGCLVIG